MPHSGRIKKVILKTPYDSKDLITRDFYGDYYGNFINHFLTIVIVKKTTGEEHEVKRFFFCRINYKDYPGANPLMQELGLLVKEE